MELEQRWAREEEEERREREEEEAARAAWESAFPWAGTALAFIDLTGPREDDDDDA